jgi:DDE superfamily endonuclease
MALYRSLLRAFIILAALLAMAVAGADGDEGGLPMDDPSRLLIMLVSLLMALFPEEFGYGIGVATQRESVYPIERKRRMVSDIMRELGPVYTRRAYRMSEDSFYELHSLLRKLLGPRTSEKKKWRNGSPNGIIISTVRLSIALRYFAGGRPEDIAIVHGVSHSEVFRSVWKVVDAVLECDDLAINFPSDHAKQRELAEGFASKSQAGFKTCCGAIDGMLLWTERFSDEECVKAGCSSKKFFCGRKHKFGLNFQAICDSESRFLDVCIQHPGATSDFLSFTTSAIYRKLEQDETFLAPGLCLFGDLAYMNCRFFATPFRSVSSGIRDDYNFYHSQLRIRIEIAFGQLVSRWGILRRALPSKLGIKKCVALACCLCRLHNFCVNERLKVKRTVNVPMALPADDLEIISHGGISLDSVDGNDQSPEDLLHGGEHQDDVSKAFRKQYIRKKKDEEFPRDKLLEIVDRSGVSRPTPKRWQK